VAFVTDTSLSDIGTGVASVHLLGQRARAYYAALGTTGDYRDYHRQDVSARDYRSQNLVREEPLSSVEVIVLESPITAIGLPSRRSRRAELSL